MDWFALPIFRAVGDLPEIWLGLDEFYAHLSFSEQACAERGDAREDFFICCGVLQADQLTRSHRHRQQNQSAVGIHYERARNFRLALALMAMHYHLNVGLYAAAAATEFWARGAFCSFSHN